MNLDMTRTANELLEVDLVVAKGVGSLGTGGDEHPLELLVVVCLAHALATAAGRGLDEDGVADLVGKGTGLLDGLDRAVASGHRGNPELLHRGLGGRLVAERVDALGRRSDEDDVVVGTGAGKVGVLGEETVARMDGLRTSNLGRCDDVGGVEIRERRRGRTDADAFVGHLNGTRVLVGLGIHDDALDAELVGGAHDAQGDFASVGDEDLVKHARFGPSYSETGST